MVRYLQDKSMIAINREMMNIGRLRCVNSMILMSLQKKVILTFDHHLKNHKLLMKILIGSNNQTLKEIQEIFSIKRKT